MANTRVWVLTILLFASAALFLAGTLESQNTYEYTAVITGKPLRDGLIDAGGIQWACKADRCTVKGPWEAPGVSACAALARQVGRLTAYGRPGRQLDAKGMDECNRAAAAPAAGPTAGRIEGRAGGSTRADSRNDLDGDAHTTDDCDDNDANRYPGNPEVGDLEGHDEDCDPTTFGFQDLDGDGHADARYFNRPPGSRNMTSSGTDCNDGEAGIHPGQVEVCNFVDDDCDGDVDERMKLQMYRDEDHDLFGDPRAAQEKCPQELAPGWVVNDYDCDDRDARKNPFLGGCSR